MKFGFGGKCEGVHRSSCCDVLRFILLSLMVLVSFSAQADQTTPYVPASASVVLQLVPPTTDPRVRQFDQLRSDFNAHAQDATKAVALAQAYIDYGRSTGDARYLGRAMAVITPFMARTPPPIPIMLVHATIQQSRHFFQASRDELLQILKRDPENVQALLTLSTVAMVQGDHDLANRLCVQMTNAAGNFMGMICTASLRGLSGKNAQAYALLSYVQDPGPKAPPAIKAWIQGLMADTAARMGKPDLADIHFKNALKLTPGDNFLLADYGEFLIDQGRAKEAVDLVSGDTQSDTSFLVLVTAEKALEAPKAKADMAEMDARFRSMDQRGDHVFLREEASYMLHVEHDPMMALDLAKQNWREQRAPKDVRVYLEAALAANDPSAAKPALDFIAKTNLSDVAIDPLVKQLQAKNVVADRAGQDTTNSPSATGSSSSGSGR
ncbi:tetratricopeptide repeat protein [Rhodanobacter sp. BL-MT-08]